MWGEVSLDKRNGTSNEENIPPRDHIWILGSNFSHIIDIRRLMLLFVLSCFLSRLLSSSRVYLPLHQGRRNIFRKIFNFIVQGNKYYLFISIIRTGDKTFLGHVCTFYCCRYCLSKHLKIKPWSNIYNPPITTRMSFPGKVKAAATTGAYALYSSGCNKNFTVFHKGAISDSTNKWAKVPTGMKFFINICMREQKHTSNI